MTDITFLVKVFAFSVFVASGCVLSMALHNIAGSRHRSSLWLVKGLSLGDGLSWSGALLVLGWMGWSQRGAGEGIDVLIITTWILLPCLALALALVGWGVISQARTHRGDRNG